MQIVFLAAGKGSRIFNKIKINKCLIKIKNKTLLSKLIETSPNNGVNKSIVTGFNSKLIIKKTKKYEINYIHNKYYKTTEMLFSMYLALKKYNDDFIFSYTDIIYDSQIIKKIIKTKPKNITLPINLNWRQACNMRKKDIYEDAESLKLNKNRIVEIGKKIKNIKDVDGQFMGIFFIPKNKRIDLIKLLEKKNLKKKQITYFINFLIKKKFTVNAIKYYGHWYEIDDFIDLKEYKKAR